jgi:hypothetical protein
LKYIADVIEDIIILDLGANVQSASLAIPLFCFPHIRVFHEHVFAELASHAGVELTIGIAHVNSKP